MEVKAYGKVNLALDITNEREDGYHDMDMVMAAIDLYDLLCIEANDLDENGNKIEEARDIILCDQPIPANNTLSQTLDLMRKKYGLKHTYTIELEKNIPSQAGLGGGSADAAALIQALNRIEHLQLSVDEMMETGAEIGADVPFCILGGYARVNGIGEICRPLYCDWVIPILLVKPSAGVSTPEAFRAFDEMEHKPLDIDLVETAIKKKDEALLYQTMVNALEPCAFEKLPVLEEIKEDMNECGIVRVMMSGSGSTMMGFCVDEELLDQAALKLKDKYPFVLKTWIRPWDSVEKD